MTLSNVKIAIHTLGCKVNIYESEAMEQLLREQGAEIVSFREAADVYLINTCTVTNMADRKSRQMLNRAKALNPDALVVACGCYAEIRKEETISSSGADLVIGNGEKSRVSEIIGEALRKKRSENAGPYREQDAVPDIRFVKDFDSMFLREVRSHTRADVKVQDGCNQFCTYCIIPYARGRILSRSPEDTVREIRELAQNGVQEVVLTGIHLSSYGKDLPGAPDLVGLTEMVHEIPGIRRIRLGSLEPRFVTEETAERLSRLPKLCPHFHLSLQSGSRTVLQRMNRHYTPEEYLEACRILHRYFDRPALTTDVIVGFPGETEEEFRDSLAFVKEVSFYEMHVFMYSRRKGTIADRMEGQIPESVKKARSAEMIALGAEMSARFRESLTGRTVSVLTEQEAVIGGKPYLTGYTKEYVKAALPVSCRENTIYTGTASGLLGEDTLLLSDFTEN